VELWRRGGLKVLPGAYTAAATSGGSNPGAPYIRVALVHETAAVEDALQRLAEIL
jgi:aspartate/methionine/tyrosine aminotransferase